ncbi:MAG: hypothetical protein IKU86_10445 [Thermoguttaceae bacterium]|nr:hypothetical protein [Thermoguttaceae bacterium]
MNEETAKAKKEIGVGGYFLRILTFWGVFILGMGAFLIFGGVCGGLLEAPKTAALVGACFFWTGLGALGVFPAFCVDALNPRPILATAFSFLVLTTFASGAAFIYTGAAATLLGGENKAAAGALFLLYVAWLVFKLRAKSVYATTRRLRWSVFTAIGVPAALSALAFAYVCASGAVSEMNPASRVFGAVFGLPTLCVYWVSAATYGGFAYIISIVEEAKRKPDESRAVENAGN